VELAPPQGVSNPVLTWRDVDDAFAVFVADPFMLPVDGTWHMFFEAVVWDDGGTKGVISHATSRDGLRWQYQRVVLEEPFHLSYPFVLASGGEHYMIPESQGAGVVRLYRADPFPHRWVHVGDLLAGPVLLDSTVFERDGRWWMMVDTSPGLNDETLRLFHAPALRGPWTEHPRSPVVRGDPRMSRPAGRVLCTPDRVLRFAQGARPDYGTDVRAFEITTLTPDAYAEREVPGGPVLTASGRGWNRRGMHHIDVHPLADGRWLACVDGWYRGVVQPRELLRQVSARRR
jgi:hypothetical protein